MEEPKITSGTVPYIASEIPDDPRDITPEQWEAMKAVDIRTVDKSQLVDCHDFRVLRFRNDHERGRSNAE